MPLRNFLFIILLIAGEVSVPVFSQGIPQPTFTLLATISDIWDVEWHTLENKLTVVQQLPSTTSICTWDEQSQTCNIVTSYDNVWKITVSPDGKMMAIGLRYSVEIIDIEAKTEIAGLPVDESMGGSSGISWSHDGTHIAIGSVGMIHVFNTDTWLEEYTLTLPLYEDKRYALPMVKNIEWSPDDRYIATESFSISPHISRLDVVEFNTGIPVYYSSSHGISWVGEGEFFSHVAGAGIILVDSTTFEPVDDYSAANAHGLSWSPDGEFMVYYSADWKRLEIVHATTKTVVADITEEIESTFIRKTAWSHDGKYLAILAENQVLIYGVSFPE